jgi:cytoskeleton protein RodZ
VENRAIVQQDRRSKLVDSRSMMSLTAQAAVAPPAAPRAGGDLRAARERLGWSIEMVAAELRIRRPYLDALEAGRIDLLPGNAYAVGFLRTYAALLGLDPDEIVRRFKAEAAEVNRQTELAFPVPLPERGMPAGALILLGVVLAVGAYVGWYRLSGEGKLPAETVIPVPQHLAPLAQQATPPVVPPTAVAKSGPEVPAAAPAPVASAAPAGLAATEPASVASATPVTSSPLAASPSATSAPSSAAPSPALASVAPGPTPGPVALDATPSVPSVSPSSAAAAPMPPSSMAQAGAAAVDRIVIQATADAWLEVRDPNGNVLLNRTLHPGDTWTVPQQAGLVFTTGNAGGTVLVVDGVASPALGNSGAVRRDLPLDPNLIRQGKLAAAPPGSVQPASLRTNGQ